VQITSILGLMAMMGASAITIDYGQVAIARQQLQSTVDAAALAGAGVMQYGVNIDGARSAILATASNNNVMGTPLSLATSDVEVGAWNEATHSIVPWSAAFTESAVRVTGRRTVGSIDGPIPLTFSRIFGLNNAQLTATAAAGVTVTNGPRKPVELMVVQDCSGSFLDEFPDAIDADFAMFDLVNGASITGDQLGYVGFNEGLKQTYNTYFTRVNGRYVYVHKDTYKELTTFGSSRTSLPSDWQTHKTLLRSDRADGYTNPAIALDWALNQYQTNGHAATCQQSVVLVSDGMPFGSTTTLTNQYRANTIAKANQLAALGVRIHTVTLTAEDNGVYGSGGADFDFNESLVRNGGVAFRTADPEALMDVLIAVGTIEVGSPHLFQ
jgi:hypothetical protein